MLGSIDPVVHAALLTVITWLVKLAAHAVGIELGEDVYLALAGVILSYILSLFGLNLWVRATAKPRGILPDTPEYRPPFTG